MRTQTIGRQTATTPNVKARKLSMKKVFVAVLGAVLISLGATGIAQAIPTIFFGEDPSDGTDGAELTRLPSHPNATTARTAFLSWLVAPLTEGFESFSTWTSAPLVVNFGTVTATLTDPFALGFVNAVAAPHAVAGRYPIGGSKYWDTVSDPSTGMASSIEFSKPQVAFGFYGTDIGDPEGQSASGGNGSLLLELAGGGTLTVALGNRTDNRARGAVLFFGLIDTDNPFTKVTFLNDSDTDFFGLDNFTIASQVGLTPTPEPSTLLLLGSGLAVSGFVLRRRRSGQLATDDEC